MGEGLRRLAAAHGIALEYQDAWGHRREASDGVLRAILGAMHVPATSAGEIDDALREMALARCRQCLPPTSVVRADAQPWRLRVHLPASPIGRGPSMDLRWPRIGHVEFGAATSAASQYA